MVDKSNSPSASLSKLPLRSVILACVIILTSQSLVREVPQLTTANADYFGAVVDAAFFSFAIKNLLAQAGAFKAENPTETKLSGLELSVTLNVGREPGTWMPQDWAASGARLLFPVKVRFSDEPLDLGFEGEEALGGRSAKRLICDGGRFIGPQGEVVVKADGGGWAVLPMGPSGENKVRFFIDFPEGAARNDVSLPAGRVFFSSACIDGEVKSSEMMGDFPTTELLEAPGGVQLTKDGRLTIKRNDLSNLYGALGDVNLYLGSFTISKPK